MSSRRFPAAAVLVLALTVFSAPAAPAADPFNPGRFEITFPEGWQAISNPNLSDSVLMTMNPVSESFCWMLATTTDHPVTEQELDILRRQYIPDDSVTKVTDGTTTLGGMSFTYVEYQPAAPSGDDPSGVRIYYTASGNTLFTALLVYDPAAGAEEVAAVESALATLKLAGTPVLARIRRAPPALRLADRDVLGRNAPRSRTILFRLPVL